MKLDLDTLFKLFEQIEKETLLEREQGPVSLIEGENDVSKAEIQNFMESMRFRISEKWGQPSSDSNIDRASITRFLDNIQGENLQQKIESLESFIKDCEEKCIEEQNISQVLGNLQFLDSFSAIVYDFNSQTSGFLFESLLAALLKGEQKSIAGGETDVEDIIFDDEAEGPKGPVSVKLLAKRSQQNLGSTANNVRAIRKFKQPMTYFVAIKKQSTKDTMQIDFYQFSLGFAPIPATNRNPENNKNIENLNRKIAADLKIPEQGYPGDVNIKFSQWDSSDKYELKDSLLQALPRIGTLTLSSREVIANIAQKYSQRLGSDLIKMYSDLIEIKNSMNAYFLNSPEAKQQVNKAASHAESLKEKIQKFTE